MTAAERVLGRCVAGPNGCIVFTGALNHGGYGIAQRGRRGAGTDRTHRIVYREMVGKIEEGMTIDHLCHNTRCCNPAHLEQVTRAENTRRQWRDGRADPGAYNRTKTECPRGHPYDDVNTAVGRNGRRTCKACSREWARAKREETKR